MIKNLYQFSFLLFLIIFTFFFSGEISASGFNLQSIGGIGTGGSPVKKFWYTGSSPVFRGEASPNSAVIIDIDGSAIQVNADSSGEWAYQTSSLSSGSHNIVLKSDGSQMSLTLVIGAENVDWDAVGQGTGEDLPTAGMLFPTILLPGIGGGLMLLSKRYLNR